MANLLPQEVQQSIFNRMLTRVIFVTSLLLSLVGVMAIGAVLPAYLTLTTEQASLSYEITSLASAATASSSGRNEVSAANKRIRAMQAIAAQPQKFTDAVSRIVSSRPTGMTIERIAYDPVTDASSTTHVITVSGVSANPGSQNTFLNALRTDGLFSLVEIPISALAHADRNALTAVLHGAF